MSRIRYVIIGSMVRASGWCWAHNVHPAARVVVPHDDPTPLAGVGADVRIIALDRPGPRVAAALEQLRAKGARG